MLYVFFGPDTFSRRDALRQLRAQLDSDGMLADATSVFDARDTSPQELIAACDTLPFLSSHRLVILEGLLQLTSQQRPRGRAKRRPDGEGGPWQPLVDYVQRMPPTTTLVLLDGDVPSDGPILQALRDKGEVRQFRPLARGSLPGWIQRRASALGLRLDGRAGALLAELVGNDLWALSSELEKLAAYSDGGPVGVEDVRALVSAARKENIFAMVDAVVEGRPAAALKLLRRILSEGDNASYVFAMIQRQYRHLAVAREMLDARLPARRVGERLGLKEYPLERLLEQARRYPLPRVRRAFHLLLEADSAIKRGQYDDELALELLVQELAAAPSRAA